MRQQARQPASAIAWLLCSALLGWLPSALFFVWVERGGALPYLPIRWDWPWIDLTEESLAVRAAWNAALILAFGLVHSALAQSKAHGWMKRAIPPSALRSAYVIVTGTTLLGVMGIWQSTGIVLWVAPLPRAAAWVLGPLLFWVLMAFSVRSLSRFDPLHFIGVRQLLGESPTGRQEGSPKLVETGMYSRLRHPAYFFTLSAFLLAPIMTLDRMLVFLSSAAYLAFAIPIEEKKLVALFGEPYLRYRERVPAVIPRLRRPG